MSFKTIKLSKIAMICLAMGVTQTQAAVLEEVVITAQKRSQSVQDIPTAVSAFSESFIADANIDDLRGLTDFTPGFNGKTEDSFTDALSMRGIVTNDFGIGGDPSIAVFTDGVWQGRTGGVQLSFYDIERAEVLKGPQGLLFGRNAIAGGINIITNKPNEENEGKVEATFAEFGHVEATGTINIPLSDQWFWRTSAYALNNDGYIKNLAGGEDLGKHDIKSIRSALRFAGDNLDATLTATYEDREQHPSVYVDPTDGLPERTVNVDAPGIDKGEIFSLALNATYDLANNMSLNSITAYKTYDFYYQEDYDAKPQAINNFVQDQEVDYYSQEFRLNSSDDTNVKWFVGASVYKEDINSRNDAIYSENALCNAIGRTDSGDFDGPVTAGCGDANFLSYWEVDAADFSASDVLGRKLETNINSIESTGWAVYGDASWAVTDRLELSAGARYTFDKKKAAIQVLDGGGFLGNTFNFEFYTNGVLRQERDWDEFTPRLTAKFELNDNVSLYANWTQGYKAGGFATQGINLNGEVGDDGAAPAGSTPLAFEPETVDSAEIGAKTRWFDDSMQVNVAAFNYSYEDLQLSYFDSGSSLVSNVGEAEGKGLELDMRYLPSDNLDIYVALSFLDTELTNDSRLVALGACAGCQGNDLPFAPNFSGSTIVSYNFPLSSGSIKLTGEYIYQGEMFTDVDNFESIKIDSWNEMNLRLAYLNEESNYSVTLWVENLTDEYYFERGWANADRDGTAGFGLVNSLVGPSKPRTIGVTLKKSF